MKKRLLSLFLVAVMCIAMLPDTALATQATSNSEPVYLGTESEYKSTLDAMFDENGLRLVSIGYNSKSGMLHKKVGLVDKYGNFVAQPIYDEIMTVSSYLYGHWVSSSKPEYFIGGYARVVRDGKEGLINTKGEEVVPCKYDYVGLPSEGICRVYKIKEKDSLGSLCYLGYWSLEKNREIVAPNKYVTRAINSPIPERSTSQYRRTSSGSYLCFHDFIDGYALVHTEPGVTKNGRTSYKSTIIDKNGKDILGKTYSTILYDIYYETYPQKGPYLSFDVRDMPLAKYKNSELYKVWKNYPEVKSGVLKFGDSDLTGLAGSKGVLIPAQYASIISLTGADFDGDGKQEGSYLGFNSTDFEIIPDKKLVITSNATNPRIDNVWSLGTTKRYGVIDFNGKTVIPFGPEVAYDDKYQVFTSGGKIYNTKGKVISKRTYDSVANSFSNGYQLVFKSTGKYNEKYSSYIVTWYIVKYDGTETNLTKALGLGKYEGIDEVSEFNTKGYLWIKREGGKWGLIDFKGKTILPFVYDSVEYRWWGKSKNGYAIVTKNGKSGIVNNAGKELVPCSYVSISDTFSSTYKNGAVTASDYRDFDGFATVLVIQGKDGLGLINIKTGKIIIPAKYDSVQAKANSEQRNLSYFDTGAFYVRLGGKTLLLDKNGKEVFSTTEEFKEAIDGLYYGNSGDLDSRGHIIIPSELRKNSNLETYSSYTIYVKDKKVYRISANYLDINYCAKMKGSTTSADKKKLDAFAQSQKEAHAKAYEQAKGNPYQ